ncbi:MAG: hypothetical protein HND48_23060 [Chloroflexi bacterium]|nr:hypothetical protein [Chloroflexota bacterium]
MQVTLSDDVNSREITAQVRALRWRIGMRAPYDVMAPGGRVRGRAAQRRRQRQPRAG